MYKSTLSLTSALDGEWVINTTSWPLYPQERDPVPIVYRRWVGTSAGLEGCGKFRPATEFDLRTEQPVAVIKIQM